MNSRRELSGGDTQPGKGLDQTPLEKQRRLVPVLTAFGAIYLVMAISQSLMAQSYNSLPTILLTTATGLIFFAARFLLSRRQFSSRTAESLGAVFAALVVINGLVHFYLISGLTETRSLALLAVGITCFFLPCRRLTLVLTTCLVAWAVISWSWGATESWLHFAFGLFAATGLRIYTELQNSKLETLLASAEVQLERRAEAERALRESEERYALAALGSPTRSGLRRTDMLAVAQPMPSSQTGVSAISFALPSLARMTQAAPSALAQQS